MSLEGYRDLIAKKRVAAVPTGISHRVELNDGLFDHQRVSTEFALRAGRAALFLDTGLQKTKSDRLLYKNFRTDGARTGGGMPEYLVVFRKWADGMDETPPVTHAPAEYPLESWQHYAQPSYFVTDLWNDTDETNVLNVGAKSDEERHLCPMPLDLTERMVRQYTNPDDVVYSPFLGIGSEGVVSLRHGRRFIGTELKPAYFRQAVKNLVEAEQLGTTTDFFASAS